MRVLELAVDPRLRWQVVGVQLARRDDRLGHLPFEVVAVQGELVEGVVGLDLLQQREGVPHEARVPQPDVANRAGVASQALRGEAVLVVEGRLCHLGEPEGGAGRGDVAVDVGPFTGELRRLDPELLDEGGIDRAHQHRDERPQAHAQDRQHPALQADVVDEQAEGDQRDEHQERQGRQLRLDIGVGRAADHAAGREVQLVALQVVARSLDQGHTAEQQRDVRLDLGADPLAGRLEPDAAVQVVEDDRDEQDHDQGDEGPAHHEGQERQPENEPADVPVELGVWGPEADRAPEQDPLVPLA